MHPVPKSPADALAIFRSPESEEWERDYAAGMIISLDEALPDLIAVACDPTASEMLQQRVAEALSFAWRDRGMLWTADISGFTPMARQEILFRRGEGPPFQGPWAEG
jgi:hypothetical protein